MPEAMARYLDLSREELAFTMERLGISTLLGLEGGPLALVPEAERVAAVQCGGRALVARSLAQQAVGNGTAAWNLSQLLIAAVGTCAVARNYASITQQSASLPPMAWYVHLLPHLAVLHTLADAGVHRFMLCRCTTDLVALLGAIVGGGDLTAPAGEPVELAGRDLDRAAGLVRKEPALAYDSLVQAGLTAVAAEQTLTLLRRATKNTMLTRARYEAPETHLVAVCGIACSPEGLWLIEPVPTEPGRVVLRPISSTDLEQFLLRLFQLEA
ncbi:MAG: hypothetical protein ABFD20_04670 [Anaerolineales bacterium]